MSTSARWVSGAAGAFATAVIALATTMPLRARDEVRALWVPRTSLTSPKAIDDMVASAQQSGFNTLLVQVRGRGDAYFLNGIEPRPASLSSQPSFDPLGDAITKGHAHGLAVHAWINVNLVAGTDVPAQRAHIVYRHPEWLMVPRQLADDLAGLDPAGPEYLGRLMRFVRSRAADLEGLYLSPATQGAVDYTTGIVRDIVQRYAIDGVYFDYLRYPSDDFDYSRETLRVFGQNPASMPDRWRQFRADRLTALVTELRKAVKAARPTATVSVVVSPDQPGERATAPRLQDWSTWLTQDLMDVVCPTAYTADAAAFASQIAAAQVVAGAHPIWAGIGTYRLSSEQTLDTIQAARRVGVGGLILSLPQLGKAAFSAQF